MARNEHIRVDRAIKILRESIDEYHENQTIVDLAVITQETIKRLRHELTTKEKVKQDLARRLLETPPSQSIAWMPAPTDKGYYWWRNSQNSPRIRYCDTDRVPPTAYVIDYGGQWAGPIPEPAEPPKEI